MAEKVGIYVCHCGSNIAGTVDVEDVAQWAGENIRTSPSRGTTNSCVPRSGNR